MKRTKGLSAFAKTKLAGGGAVSPPVLERGNEFEPLAPHRAWAVNNSAVSVGEELPAVDPLLQTPTAVISSIEKDTARIELFAGESIVLLGLCDLVVEQGKVELFGAIVLPNNSHIPTEIFAASSHSLPVITGLDGSSSGGSRANIFVLTSIWGGVREMYMVAEPFNGLWDLGEKQVLASERLGHATFSILGHDFLYSKRDHKHLVPFRPNESWRSAVQSVTTKNTPDDQARRVLICGPKNSGKSTMTRYLANALLAVFEDRHKWRAAEDTYKPWEATDGVAILDIDPGQPEFGPPGTLSLVHVRSYIFGPPFSHLLHHAPLDVKTDSIIRQHFLASITPKTFPATYIEAIENLTAEYMKMLEVHPKCHLIVNASGWMSGEGLEMLKTAIYHMKLTNVFHMSDTGPVDAIQYFTERCSIDNIKLSLIHSQPSLSSRSAAVLRQMQFQSYTHMQAIRRADTTRWEIMPLSRKEGTICLDYSGNGQTTLPHGIVTINQQMPQHLLKQVLAGSVVGIVIADSLDAFSHTHQGNNDWLVNSQRLNEWSGEEVHPTVVRTIPHGLPYVRLGPNLPIISNPWTSRCLGIGIVQFVAVSRQRIFVETPVTVTEIRSACNAGRLAFLVQADVDVQNWKWRESRAKRRLEGSELASWATPSDAVPFREANEPNPRELISPEDFDYSGRPAALSDDSTEGEEDEGEGEEIEQPHQDEQGMYDM